MDPYLEDPAYWSDFHLTFIGCWREAIADVLPEPYEASETVHFVQMSPEAIKLIYPNVAVSRGRKSSRGTSRRAGSTAVMKPKIIPHRPLDEVRHGRIEILHRPGRSLVAVLEMLSPANKVGDGFAEFCAKRQAILKKKVHLVELDLFPYGQVPRAPMAEKVKRWAMAQKARL
jgi:hypothetical protein